jgi:hypothetical protein
MRGSYRVLVGKPDGKRSLGTRSCRWEDNNEWISKSGLGGMDWIDLTQAKDRWHVLANEIINLLVT